ncbi:MAG TPA: TetR/AcrR family transcriptional regulator [Candidatus Binataceae bacterium]|nr:TetR/AcrR family transcriptional regulator [Candidatus Binataceae bacterium]
MPADIKTTTADARITAAEPRASSPELRAQDSRDEILKAATGLFANRGFHETSMSEVAKAASVSKALIFWHFKTKEDLFMAVLSGLLEPYFIDFTEEAGALDEKAQIIRLIELYLLFVRDNAGSIRFFVAQLLHDERPSDGLANQVMQLYDGYRTLLVDLIGRAQNNFVCIRDFPPQAVASMLLATLNGLLIGFLFAADQAVQVESAVSMIRQWLFHDGPQVGLPPSL